MSETNADMPVGMGETASRGMAANGMAAALGKLWVRFLPEIEARVAVIETTIAQLSAGGMSAETRQSACRAAHEAAHKLAGTLGTFGVMEGTTLARAVENSFASEANFGDGAAIEEDGAMLRLLAEQATRLRAVVASRGES